MSTFPMDAPRDLVMPAAWQQGAIIVIGLALVLSTLFALWRVVRLRDPLLLLSLAGGALAVLLEPIADVLGQAYHPEVGQITAFTLLGRAMPVHVALIYPVYFGLTTWLLLRSFENGISRAQFWKLAGGIAVFAFGVEVIPVHVGLWKYYGEQPFNFYGMPLWWYVVNPTAIIGTAALSYIAVRDLEGWGRWPLVVLIPFCAAGVHTGLAAPIYMGLNSGNTAAQNILPALASVAFCATMLLIFKRLIVVPGAAVVRGGVKSVRSSAMRGQPA